MPRSGICNIAAARFSALIGSKCVCGSSRSMQSMPPIRERTRSHKLKANAQTQARRRDAFITVQLNERESVIFEGLVIGSAVSTLDDGEAATIARAVGGAATPIIDERKVNRICRESYPEMQVGCTVDLLCHERVAAAL